MSRNIALLPENLGSGSSNSSLLLPLEEEVRSPCRIAEQVTVQATIVNKDFFRLPSDRGLAKASLPGFIDAEGQI